MSLSSYSRVLVLAAGLVGLAASASAQTITKSFGAVDIALNHTTTLTYTISSGAAGLATFGFDDTLTAGLVPNFPAIANDCNGTPSGALSYTGGSLAANLTCHVTFTVKGTTPGNKSSIVSGNGSGGLAGKVSSKSLSVISPTFTKTFLSPTIPLNGHTTLRFSISNSTNDPLLVGWTDPLPNGMHVAIPLVLPPGCDGAGTVSVTAGVNSDTINVANGTIGALGFCSLDFDIVARASTAGTGNIATGTQDLQTINPVATIVVNEPTFEKSFVNASSLPVTSIPLGGTATLKLRILNNTGSTLSSVGFNDPMPEGLQVSPGTVAYACTPSTTLLPGPVSTLASVSLSSAILPNGTSCVITATVIATAVGGVNFLDNTGGVVTSNNIVTGTGDLLSLDRLASLDIRYPGFKKTASPSVFRTDTGMTTFTITLNNNTGFNLADLRFSDTLPAGLTLVAGSIASGCPGAKTDSANGFAIGAFALADGVTCTVTFNATGAPIGTYINTAIGDGSLAGLVTAAEVTVTPPPTFTKTFDAPKAVNVNGIIVATFFIENKTGATVSAGFTDDMSLLGIEYDSPVSNICTAGATPGTLAPATGPSATLALNGASLPNNTSCTIKVKIKGKTVGTWKNTAKGTGALVGIDPFDSVTVGDVVFSKKFNLSTINLNATSTLTFKIDNSIGVALGQPMGFTDDLGALNLTVADNTFVPAAPCTGSVTIAGNIVTYNSTTSPSLAAGQICTFSVPVIGSTAGTKNNVAHGTGALSPKTAPDTLIVNKGPIGFTKTFNPKNVPLNGPSVMTIVLNNTSGAVIPNADFSDTFPTGVKYVSIKSNTCTIGAAGTITPPPVAIFPEVLGFKRAGLEIGASCTVEVNVTGAAFGAWLNTVTPLDDLVGVTPPSDTLTVGNVIFSKMFAPPTIDYLSPNPATSTLKFTIDNTNGPALGQPMGFTDDLGALGLTTTALVFNPAAPCTGTVTIAGNIVTYNSTTSPALAAGAKCEFSVTVKGSTSGLKHNVAIGTGSLATFNAPADLTVTPGHVSFTKLFSTHSIGANSPFDVTFTLTNASGATANNFGFDDDMTALGLVIAGPVTGNTCGVAPTALLGSSIISIANVTLVNDIVTPSSSCKFTVSIKGTMEGFQHNVAIGKGALAGQTATDDVTILSNRFTKSFTPGTVVYTGAPLIVRLTWTITNVTGGALPGGFTDALPAATGTVAPKLKVANPANAQPSVATANCGGVTFNPGIGLSSVTFGPATIPAGATCTVSMDVEVPGIGFYHNVAVGSGLINGIQASADLDVAPPARKEYQLRYFSNLTAGDSYINLTNDGASSTLGSGVDPQNGNICVNAYTYSPDEQLVSCCSCVVTPNGLASFSVVGDLASNPLTPVVPASVVVKLLATRQANSCNAALVTRADLRGGLEAFGATLHEAPVPLGSPKKYATTETKFHVGELSDAELKRMTGLCAFIQANGSGYGVCKSCRVAGLGASSR